VRIELTLAADLELAEAIAYYNSRTLGLGSRFLIEFEEACGRIIAYPDAWQSLTKNVCRYQLKDFPYGLVYAIEDDVALVIAVMHLKRRPGYWRKRLRELKKSSS